MMRYTTVRPKPEQYADRTWMPPRGTRRSMGKRYFENRQYACFY